MAGEFYVNAINVMRGAEAVSTYAPIEESEKFRIEYWALEEGEAPADAGAEAARHRAGAGHRGRKRDREGDRAAVAAEGAGRRGDLNGDNAQSPRNWAVRTRPSR
ncbi:bifunctional rhamnulose-1-phosphate aldolase/short-chain dehydrogenase [Streptomyces hirsutus]